MVLLHVLHVLSAKHRWKLAVAHFNHGLRGRAADADERFVARAAAGLGLKFKSEKADVRAFARQKKLSVEMGARHLRHDFLARAARSMRVPNIALAHHGDDQVELFFLRLMRGAGTQGLGGMDFSGVSPADQRIRLIRPFLREPKSELAKFAREQNVAFREDATNQSTDILRNRVRLKVLPLLRRQFHSQFDALVLRSMELLRDEGEFVMLEALRFLEKAQTENAFAELHTALQRRIIQVGLLKNGIAPQFEHIEALRTKDGEWASLAPKLFCRRDSHGGRTAWARARPIRHPLFAGLQCVQIEALRTKDGEWASLAPKLFYRRENLGGRTAWARARPVRHPLFAGLQCVQIAAQCRFSVTQTG